ncbi:tetratricopeptide repeat protein [Leptospira yasudae]|uniref:tetratricopeptide repeat protein n=1 Tax=Leptospira yasudae TaxID=2202201 RepID=UPI001CED9428|nr:tetratricopeptide repeat protein [Leptospira yasudae]
MLKPVTSERLFYEYGRSLLGVGKFDDAKAAFQNSIRKMFATELPEESLYLIGAAYSAEGKIQESLTFLKYAIDRGFSDLERVENEHLFENLRKSKGWKDLKRSLQTRILNYSPSTLTGAITFFGPNNVVVHLLCPNQKLVTYSERDYDVSKNVFLGDWSINMNHLSLNINQRCFAKGVGKARFNHNEQEVYDSYKFAGCIKSSSPPEEIPDGDMLFTKSDLAALFRPFYGEEFEVEGIGFRYHKFSNGLPMQCKDNFIPKSMSDLTVETKQYLKAY